MSTSPETKIPRYLRLADQLRRDVRAGKLKPGDRLPSFATMKAQHGLSQNTWDKAHALLEQERVIVRLPNKGTFVAEPSAHPAVGVIGIAMGKAPWQHPYYSQLLKGIHKAAHQAQLEVLLLSQDLVVAWEKVDGVLVVGKVDATFENMPPNMPCVTVLYDRDDTASIVAADSHGMQEAVEYLLSLGHRRIGYLADNVVGATAASNIRLAAYKSALKAAGIAPNKRWVRSLSEIMEPRQPFSALARQKMGVWLHEDWDAAGCTALLTQNDETAIGAIEAFHEAGRQVPHQVSVIGFDGTEIAEYYRPRLTTVNVPLEMIGAAGVKQLVDKINEPSSPEQHEAHDSVTVIPARLVIGESTAPPLS